MTRKRRLRVVFAVVLAVTALTVGSGYAINSADGTVEDHLDGSGPTDPDARVAPQSDGITVVATDSNSWLGSRGEGPRARAELLALAPNGSILHYDDSHTRYWDVDPVPGTEATVEYGYSDHLTASECPDDWNASEYAVDRETWDEYYAAHSDVGACTRNGYERVNLTTGEVTPVWSQVTPGKPETRYHDVDRINDTHLLVADIYLDRVFVVNAETGRIGWTWNATEAFSPEATGGPYPEDWTHVNDVELLSDGRVMASLRNHDRVVFLNRTSGLVENWTLGNEDDYDTLYEQHNPDYIDASSGGPAVVVGDSENNRVIEYQRENGTWEKSWTWRDARMQWPRDADRLPNGNTLITDSNGNRVFEVNRQGEVVWSVDVAFPYEAERLGTGDESSGGESARRAGVETRTPPLDEQFWILLKNLIPGKYLNGLMYVTPAWMGFPELFASVLFGVVALLWLSTELLWAVVPRVRSSGAGSDLEDRRVEDD
ncbi:aryl-sulfate sulfotransferase [Halorussus aquaticus]|uniref:Aryl-sulfate sulfotransferase n=1 Tax=Halorussus aquaticus TaxID=2953748 RepID=A0ABD5Q1B0_9EURY|nr:aryl-sulfate sulfotransferase [Halorussus aquaticus]